MAEEKAIRLETDEEYEIRSLRECKERAKKEEEVSRIQQDHEFLEKLYATEIDSAERIKLIKKHFFGEKNNANDI